MIRKIILAALLAFTSAATTGAASPQDDAVSAAKVWLKMVDDKDYAASWADAAQLFKDRVTQEQWVAQVSVPRAQLGDLKSRSFQSFTETKSLPGVPDGDYAIITFDTVFANKAQSAEMLSLVLQNGVWKAGGYFIK
jgi:hypothetical protein